MPSLQAAPPANPFLLLISWLLTIRHRSGMRHVRVDQSSTPRPPQLESITTSYEAGSTSSSTLTLKPSKARVFGVPSPAVKPKVPNPSNNQFHTVVHDKFRFDFLM